jgi:hypothetical protein
MTHRRYPTNIRRIKSKLHQALFAVANDLVDTLAHVRFGPYRRCLSVRTMSELRTRTDINVNTWQGLTAAFGETVQW